jgi:hypothetical protein
MKTDAAEILALAANTFRERNAMARDNYKVVGRLLEALFPEGLKVESAHDWERLNILLSILGKLTRYTQSWKEGGHEASLLDIPTYAAILAMIDANKNEAPF